MHDAITSSHAFPSLPTLYMYFPLPPPLPPPHFLLFTSSLSPPYCTCTVPHSYLISAAMRGTVRFSPSTILS